MDTLMQDFRYAFRTLGRTRSFTLAAIATLALGFGANTAMFSVVHAVLLKPLPYPEPERLLRVRSNSSHADLVDLARLSRQFEGFGGYRAHFFDIPAEPLAQRVDGALVSGSVFRLLGVPAARGRALQETDDVAGGEKVAVVSDGFWRQRMGADPAAVGRSFTFVSGSYRVVGVMPPGFRLPQIDQADVFGTLLVDTVQEAQARGAHTLRGFTRTKPGVDLAQAQAEMDALQPRMAEIDPIENKERRYVLSPLHAYVVRDVRGALLLLFGAVAFVLLIAAANVMNLLLARAAERQREIAIRSSLGAGRARILRQLVVESVLLAAAGGVVGLAVAAWMLDVVVALGADQVPALADVQLDGRVLAFTASVSLLVGIVFGLAPGLLGSARDVVAPLKEGSRGSEGPGRDRLRRLLVASEVALAVVLLSGAGLLLRSLHRLQSVDPGFDTRGLLTFNVTLPMDRYRDIPKRTAFAEGLLERMAAQPGVVAAGATSELPFAPDHVPQNLLVEGSAPVEPGQEPEVNSRSVTVDYFRALGMPLKRGRGFARDDAAGTLPVGIVNETAVRQLFSGADPVGKRVAWAQGEPLMWITVVGVVGDVRGTGLDADDLPALYTPMAQEFRPWRTWMYLAVRSTLPPAAIVEPVKADVGRVDKDVPVTKVRSMDELVAASFGDRRFHLTLLGAFAAVALALAAVGIHGVIAYTVSRRTREMGVRMALGATTSDVLRLVVGQGLGVAVAGLAAGVLAALALRRLVASMLFDVRPADPLTFGAVTAVLLLVALLACLAPARRAARVDPAVALRYE
jgi:putative ABC transport system permease protein